MTRNINAGVKMGIKGEFKCILWNEDGSKALETDWSSNLITNNGLTIFGTEPWYIRCYLGDDATAPAVTDTSLGNIISGASDSYSNAYSDADYPRPPVGPDWERWSGKRYRFNAGNGTGTVREICIAENVNNIFCRHVLPVAIPKAANQALDVFYKFTVYIDSTPTTGQITLDGVTYDWEFKPVRRTTFNYSIFARQGLDDRLYVYDDNNISGTDTTLPTGGEELTAEVSMSVVGSGQGYRDYQYTLGIGQLVTTAEEIRYIVFYNATYHRFQLSFTATNGSDIGGPLPKTAVDVLILTVRLAWDRYI